MDSRRKLVDVSGSARINYDRIRKVIAFGVSGQLYPDHVVRVGTCKEVVAESPLVS